VTTSKSPRRVLRVAYDAARRALPAHRHKFSPKKFTQPQLLACLVLKEFLRTDYRGLAAHLDDHPDLARSIDLKAVPHYTTFQKAAARLLVAAPARKMFDAVLERALRDKVRRRRVPLAAVDGTGMTITLWTDERAAQEAAENLSQHGALPPGVTITRQESRAVVAVV